MMDPMALLQMLQSGGARFGQGGIPSMPPGAGGMPGPAPAPDPRLQALQSMGQMPEQAQRGQPPAKRPMPAPSQGDGEGEDQALLDQIQSHIGAKGKGGIPWTGDEAKDAKLRDRIGTDQAYEEFDQRYGDGGGQNAARRKKSPAEPLLSPNEVDTYSDETGDYTSKMFNDAIRSGRRFGHVANPDNLRNPHDIPDGELYYEKQPPSGRSRQ